MNLMDLFVKISVDDQASSQVETIGSKLKSGLATAAKVGAAAVAAAGTAIVAVGKQAIEQYAEYEQLVGGVETLFKQSADTVMSYAENAYKTAGLSANEYMNTVTSFSASLLQSLGGDTEAAAKYADMAITDMSDNANKMGTSMEMIQNAYQGFAKQNYTMLDNLKLGYGGTKEEMQRLLEDAEKLSGIKYDISSYADIVDAIHVVQTEMGITGTTAKEASTTIQGSVSAMKSAWANLITGIADDNADLDALIGNFVDSIATAGENIIPRVEQILVGIGETITKMAPVISEAVPNLVANVIPTLLGAGVQLIDAILQGLITALPALAESAVSIVDTMITTIVEQLPAFLEAAVEVIVTLANGIAQSLPELIPTIVDVVLKIVDILTSPETLNSLVEAAISIMLGLAEGLIKAIPNIVAAIPTIIENLIQAIIGSIPQIIEAGIQLFVSLIANLPEIIVGIVKAIPQIVVAIVEGFMSLIGKIKDVGKSIVNGVWEGIKAMASWIKDKVTGFFSGIVSGVKNLLGIHSPSKVFAGIGKFMAEGLGDGFDDQFKSVKENIEKSMNFDDANASINVSSNLQKQVGNFAVPTQNTQNNNDRSIHLTVVSPDGKELARFIAPYMGAQLQLVRG